MYQYTCMIQYTSITPGNAITCEIKIELNFIWLKQIIGIPFESSFGLNTLLVNAYKSQLQQYTTLADYRTPYIEKYRLIVLLRYLTQRILYSPLCSQITCLLGFLMMFVSVVCITKFRCFHVSYCIALYSCVNRIHLQVVFSKFNIFCPRQSPFKLTVRLNCSVLISTKPLKTLFVQQYLLCHK